MRSRQPSFLAVAIMTIALAGCAPVQIVLAPKPIALATGVPGGIAHAVGNAICRMFNLRAEHQARPCDALSSDGSLVNIQQVESGKSAFGLSETDLAYAAYHGGGPFAVAGPDPKLRMLIALYPEAFTVLAHANSGIRNFRDLRGKRIGVGTSGAGFTFTRDVVLGFYGWKISDAERLLELGPAEQNPRTPTG
jgi:TRAP transporter TAXI family solute receptor